MKRKAVFLTLAILVSLFSTVNAEITLPAVIGSNMVLQRNSEVALWGWAEPGEKISVRPSWIKKALTLTADDKGNWQCRVQTTNNTSETYTIRFSSKFSDLTLQNIVFGEVWICSGQSNMFQPVKGYNGQPTFGSTEAIINAKNPNLRLFTAEKKGAKTPLADLEGFVPWQEASNENVPDFSAVAYFFGSQLQKTLNVPVGLIHTSWGGSFVEAWMSREVLEAYQTIDLEGADLKQSQRVKTALFNAMIAPIIPYTIKGALWYQGESNRNEPDDYKILFPAMVQDWRSRWDLGEFPFYFVQIAPFHYNNDAFNVPNNSAFIREAQLECVNIIPNSGIAVTMDLGAKDFIHPPRKKEVADRLLFNALNKTYGFTGVDCASPVYKSLEKKNGGLVLIFEHAENGLYTFGDLEGFEIAGPDRVFHPAEASIINGSFVFVKSDKVANPVAARYAWRNWVKGTLFDTSLLPASSFRTDNWQDATRAGD